MKYESEYYDRGGQVEIDRAELEAIYERNKAAKCGAIVSCTCGKIFTKKTSGQAFHQTKCKDRYWNTVDDTRRERVKMFS